MIYNAIKGYLLEIRIPAMLVALLTAILGSSAATMGFLPMNYATVTLHTVNVFTILYMAHLVDTLNDRFIRDEYGSGYRTRFGDAGKQQMSREHFIGGIIVCLIIAIGVTAWLTLQTGPLYMGLAAFGIILAVSYGFGLDKVFILGDLAWEFGVIFSLWGGFFVQAGSLETPILVMALLVMPALTGFKIVDALPDIEPDEHAGKITAPVKFGFNIANTLAYILMGISVVLLGIASQIGMLPPPIINSILLFGAITGVSAAVGPRKGVYVITVAFTLLMLQGIYLLYPPLFGL